MYSAAYPHACRYITTTTGYSPATGVGGFVMFAAGGDTETPGRRVSDTIPELLREAPKIDRDTM
jgi:hypothetical protein